MISHPSRKRAGDNPSTDETELEREDARASRYEHADDEDQSEAPPCMHTL